MNREEWLNEVTDKYLDSMFKRDGYVIPDNIVYSCGFPSRKALAAKNRTIGQCFYAETSEQDMINVFISPVVSDSVEVLAILIHELVHAIHGKAAGHGKLFRACALSMGLTGKMTATKAGDELKESLKDIVEEFGEYPHAKIDMTQQKKQTTRMIKAECIEHEYIVRLSRKCAEIGAPICPCCEKSMTIT